MYINLQICNRNASQRYFSSVIQKTQHNSNNRKPLHDKEKTASIRTRSPSQCKYTHARCKPVRKAIIPKKMSREKISFTLLVLKVSGSFRDRQWLDSLISVSFQILDFSIDSSANLGFDSPRLLVSPFYQMLGHKLVKKKLIQKCFQNILSSYLGKRENVFKTFYQLI